MFQLCGSHYTAICAYEHDRTVSVEIYFSSKKVSTMHSSNKTKIWENPKGEAIMTVLHYNLDQRSVRKTHPQTLVLTRTHYIDRCTSNYPTYCTCSIDLPIYYRLSRLKLRALKSSSPLAKGYNIVDHVIGLSY